MASIPRLVTITSVLSDASVAKKPIPGQTVMLTETRQSDGATVTLPPMTTAADGSASEDVTVQVPNTFTFAVSYAGGVVGTTTYSPASRSTAPLHVGSKSFGGSVSAEVGPGEIVTIVFTRASDGSVVQTSTAQTQFDKTFTVEFDGTTPGNYLVTAMIGKDSLYSAATSSAPFVI